MNLMKYRLALVLGVAGAMILGACKSASPTPPAVTGTPTQISVTATVTPRPTRRSVRTATSKPTLSGTAYPGPVQSTLVTTLVITPEPTQQIAQPPTTAPAATAIPAPTQVPSPVSRGGTPTQEAYPPPGAYAPTQPGYPGPDYTAPTPLPNPYPGPATQPPVTQPPATQPPVTQPPVTQSPAPLTPQPTSTPRPAGATPAPALVQTTPTPNPIYNTFTPTPTFPLSLGDTQFRVTDPAKVELATGEYQFVEFFAYWCGPCRAMAPLLNGLEDQYKNRIQFTYLDIDNPATQPFKNDLHFRIEPEYYLLDGQGKVLKQWSGYVRREELQAVFDAVLK